MGCNLCNLFCCNNRSGRNSCGCNSCGNSCGSCGCGGSSRSGCNSCGCSSCGNSCGSCGCGGSSRSGCSSCGCSSCGSSCGSSRNICNCFGDTAINNSIDNYNYYTQPLFSQLNNTMYTSCGCGLSGAAYTSRSMCNNQCVCYQQT